jgi:hypothetical protein
VKAAHLIFMVVVLAAALAALVITRHEYAYEQGLRAAGASATQQQRANQGDLAT